MPATRSSARIASKSGSGSEPTSSPSAAGTKRKTDTGSSPAAKRGKKTEAKEQKTLEETISSSNTDGKPVEENGTHETKEDVEMKEPEQAAPKEDEKREEKPEHPALDKTQEKAGEKAEEKTEENPEEKAQAQVAESQPETTATNGESAVEPKGREGETPSNILEKGIIYFFFRGRVGIDDPKDVNDIARSYIVVRPIAHDAKLGEGPIGDAGNSRLFALPKKVLPTSGRDRFITFVEKTHSSFKQLKDEFLSSADYETKTVGVRHTPAATPVGEGVYSITTTGRESHLAYILTVPSELGEVQKELGLRERGSFIISTRNPDYPAPNNASLPQGPSYPQEIKDSFRSLRWQGTKPQHLDFVNTQFLLIGESRGLESATEPQKKDQEEGKKEPKEELEKLEDEDEHRVEGLKGDESAVVFADLEVHSKVYHGLQTTWAD